MPSFLLRYLTLALTQCNFSGRRYPLAWAAALNSGSATVAGLAACDARWRVCACLLTLVCLCHFVSSVCMQRVCLYLVQSHHSHPRLEVLLDAASHVSTSALDLQASPADFVCLSFYKMFGFPTGLGALLVRNTACVRAGRRASYMSARERRKTD